MSTGYSDWHVLGAHAIAMVSGDLDAEARLINFFGSRSDWAFFVHGAGWGKVVEAYRKGRFKISPLDTTPERYPKGTYKTSFDIPGQRGIGVTVTWSDARSREEFSKFCPRVEGTGASDGSKSQVSPFLVDCHHGMGHGAFLVAAESLASEGRPFSLVEVDA